MVLSAVSEGRCECAAAKHKFEGGQQRSSTWDILSHDMVACAGQEDVAKDLQCSGQRPQKGSPCAPGCFTGSSDSADKSGRGSEPGSGCQPDLGPKNGGQHETSAWPKACSESCSRGSPRSQANGHKACARTWAALSSRSPVLSCFVLILNSVIRNHS